MRNGSIATVKRCIVGTYNGFFLCTLSPWKKLVSLYEVLKLVWRTFTWTWKFPRYLRTRRHRRHRRSLLDCSRSRNDITAKIVRLRCPFGWRYALLVPVRSSGFVNNFLADHCNFNGGCTPYNEVPSDKFSLHLFQFVAIATFLPDTSTGSRDLSSFSAMERFEIRQMCANCIPPSSTIHCSSICVRWCGKVGKKKLCEWGLHVCWNGDLNPAKWCITKIGSCELQVLQIWEKCILRRYDVYDCWKHHVIVHQIWLSILRGWLHQGIEVVPYRGSMLQRESYVFHGQWSYSFPRAVGRRTVFGTYIDNGPMWNVTRKFFHRWTLGWRRIVA
jgi:hypothetical protein